MKNNDIKRRVIELSKLPYKKDFTDTTGLIITTRIGEDRYLNTASGISFRRFTDTEKDLVILDGDLNRIEGDHPVPASSQISIAILKAFPETNTVLHVHSHVTAAFASLGLSPKPVTPAAKRIGHVPVIFDESLEDFHQNGGDLGLIPLKNKPMEILGGTKELIETRHRFSSTVVRELQDGNYEFSKQGVGFLVDFDYGLFTVGRHLDEPFDTIERIINNAKMLLSMKTIDNNYDLSDKKKVSINI
ncbi:class II aldolase/adducin family protein [Bacillus cereus]|uniref:Class II aldolase/adducin N-terminal domain-containing protein n=1 Tax=Bacillus cereus HuA2-1 TaxID=1053201 RepID=J8XXW4_BACCE|nr:class II aldolase/adducin family protein [Bacillus cereus]EJV74128.1 hypothetical protein IG3_05950 [Bacillus cereus HuA2-1]